MKKFVIGIDLGGTKILGGLLRLDCRVVKQIEIKLGKFDVLDKIKGLIHELINQPGIEGTRILGIGIGSPGFVDYEKGVVKYAGNITGWKNIALRTIIEKEFRIPVCIDHDINTSALGELMYGAGKGRKDFAFITIGTGIGMGLVTGGRICRVGGERAGNLGHMIISRNFDCIEKYGSGLAIIKNARDAISKGQGNSILNLAGEDIKRIEAKTVFAAARRGDGTARRIINDAIDAISIGIANVAFLLGIDFFVVGGGVANAGKSLFIPLSKKVNDLISSSYMGGVDLKVKIVPSKLGNITGLVGAAQLVFRDYERL